MPEQFTEVSPRITLCHDSFGDPANPPVLLIMGLGTQMIAWDDEFCEQIAGHGFHVVRFDNRDIGRSTHLDFKPPPVTATLTRRLPAHQYTLEQMADETAVLVEKLELGPVHVVGASMGGMIAQLFAARHPNKTNSLVSIMSNTGSRVSGQPAFSIYRHFLSKPPSEREAAIERGVNLFRVIGSTPLGFDEPRTREIVTRSIDRDPDPRGTARQLGAIAKSGNRSKVLKTIRVPTLVVHGTADVLVRPSGGKATAKAIPGAELKMIEGMGHDLHRATWDTIVEGIVRTANRSGAGSPANAVAA
jgi:pimeloyl-ACP methyl ester carboxylesterase